MTRVIQFNAPNLPNFGEANELYKLSMGYADKAIAQGKQTFDDAVKAVENRNHAQIQSMINGYNRDELLDPTVQFNIQEDIKRLGLDTGNIYDPMKVNTYLDTRPDTLLQRGSNELDYANKVVSHSDKNLDFGNKVLNDQAYKIALGIDAITGQRDPNSPAVQTSVQNFLKGMGVGNDPVLGGLVGKNIFDININEEDKIANLQGKHNINHQTQVKTNTLEQMTPYQVAQSIANIGKTNAETDGIKANTHLTNVKADSVQTGDALKVADQQYQQTKDRQVQQQRLQEFNQEIYKSYGWRPDVIMNGNINLPSVRTSLDSQLAEFQSKLNDLSNGSEIKKGDFDKWVLSDEANKFKERVGTNKWERGINAIAHLRDPNLIGKGVQPLTDAEAMQLISTLPETSDEDFFGFAYSHLRDMNLDVAKGLINKLRQSSTNQKTNEFKRHFSNQIRSLDGVLPSGIDHIGVLVGLGVTPKHPYYNYLDDNIKSRLNTVLGVKVIEPTAPTIPKNPVYEDVKKIAPNAPTPANNPPVKTKPKPQEYHAIYGLW